ncbi:hypothetical protein SLA2020_412650 [Shorea laevis]
MRSGLGPIYPSDASVKFSSATRIFHQCWNIVLVHVPRGSQNSSILASTLVWYDLDGQAAVELDHWQPLRH